MNTSQILDMFRPKAITKKRRRSGKRRSEVDLLTGDSDLKLTQKQLRKKYKYRKRRPSERFLLETDPDLNLTQRQLRKKYGYKSKTKKNYSRSRMLQGGRKKPSRRMVYNNRANGKTLKTSGGLTKGDLVRNKWGRIVSRKKSERMKRLVRSVTHPFHRFLAKKGEFGPPKPPLFCKKNRPPQLWKLGKRRTPGKFCKSKFMGGMGSEGPYSPETF